MNNPNVNKDEKSKPQTDVENEAQKIDREEDQQGTERGAPGLGELDGTNPGSNSHPMDDE